MTLGYCPDCGMTAPRHLPRCKSGRPTDTGRHRRDNGVVDKARRALVASGELLEESRKARDSMPPLRLAILDDVAANPDTPTRDVRKRLGKPRATVDRQLQALNMLGVLDVDEDETEWAGRPATVWRYRLADGIDPKALDPESVPDSATPMYSDDCDDGDSPTASLMSYERVAISGTELPSVERSGHSEPKALSDAEPASVETDSPTSVPDYCRSRPGRKGCGMTLDADGRCPRCDR